jgi:hypothetical protein
VLGGRSDVWSATCGALARPRRQSWLEHTLQTAGTVGASPSDLRRVALRFVGVLRRVCWTRCVRGDTGVTPRVDWPYRGSAVPDSVPSVGSTLRGRKHVVCFVLLSMASSPSGIAGDSSQVSRSMPLWRSDRREPILGGDVEDGSARSRHRRALPASEGWRSKAPALTRRRPSRETERDAVVSNR